MQHRINTGPANPIRQPPRRLPFGKREVEKQELEKMLKRNVIEPSNSAWSSPIVLVSKKDGSTRFCVDYRKLNDVTIKDAYPLPRIDECLDSLSESKWFSCMDLNSGFWQIGMDPADKHKTAFSTSQGLYQFTVMPFGLANSPSTFERLMEDVFRGLQWRECLIYIDDIIVPGKTVEDTLIRLEHVFLRLQAANLKLKPSKCSLFQKEIKVLGHVVSEKGIHTDPDKTKAVQDWPIPTSVKEVRSFLGLCSYYRRFVQGFAAIARPLHLACQKDKKFQWNEDCSDAFQKLKEVLVSPPILIYPIPGQRFILDTDASNMAVGAVLSQIENDQEKVVSYYSKALNKHEQSYCTTRKELLAVVSALKHFHSYLYGQPVLLRTDNAAVNWMRNLKNPTGQVARWLQELGTYNLTVVHRPGIKHSNADALSRRPCKACKRQQDNDPGNNSENESSKETEQNDTDVSHVCIVTRGQHKTSEPSQILNTAVLQGWEPDQIRFLQLQDPYISPIMTLLDDASNKPVWSDISHLSSSTKTLWRQWDRLQVQGGILYRTWKADDKETRIQLVVPSIKQSEVIKYYHDIPSAGHLGTEKTLERIKNKFYWPNIKESVEKYVKTCSRCSARKNPVDKRVAPLRQYLVGEPMERIEIDVMGPLPLSLKGNKYILVVCDCFTKWTEAYAIPNQEAETVVKVIVNEFLCRFGTPLQIHSDQGRNFESQLFQQMCQLFHIDKTRTTSMRPQSNGNIERFNRTLATMLTMYCEKEQNKWDEYLPQVMMAYRSSVHSSTHFTPNMMVFGRNITMPLEAVTCRPANETESDTQDYISDLQAKLHSVHVLARRNLKTSAEHQKRYYDIKASKKSLDIGQLVWLYEPLQKKGVCKKLSCPWSGPCLILEKIDDTTYRVKRSPRKEAKLYHIDRLSLYKGRDVPAWIRKLQREIEISSV